MIHNSKEEYKMLHLLHRCQSASRTPSVLQFLNKDLEYLNRLHSYSATKLFSTLVPNYKVAQNSLSTIWWSSLRGNWWCHHGQSPIPSYQGPPRGVQKVEMISHLVEKKTCQGVANKTLQMMMICKGYFTQCWPPTFTEALSFVAGAGVKVTYE